MLELIIYIGFVLSGDLTDEFNGGNIYENGKPLLESFINQPTANK